MYVGFGHGTVGPSLGGYMELTIRMCSHADVGHLWDPRPTSSSSDVWFLVVASDTFGFQGLIPVGEVNLRCWGCWGCAAHGFFIKAPFALQSWVLVIC